MKVTVCQLHNDPQLLRSDWRDLVAHVRHHQSDLVLLPEMPFHPWVCRSRTLEPSLWDASVDAHRKWLGRLHELSPAVVAATVPITDGGRRYNEAFLWSGQDGYRALRRKTYLPDEENFWEATWYDRGPAAFAVVQAGAAKLGFLICTELWFVEHARTYSKEGIHLLLVPRATGHSSADKWLAGGRVAAVVSGAFCLSSCFGGIDHFGMHWAGQGWIIEPEEGDILGLTSASQPFMTLDIDLLAAEKAKKTYPRYVQQ